MAKEYGTTDAELKQALKSAESTINIVFRKHAGRNAVVTFTTNGRHSKNSLHYSGYAVDLRVRDLTRDTVGNIVKELSYRLTSDFDVLDEVSHIHIEYDPK